MVKGRRKGKKLHVTNNEDRETREDKKIPSQKRRGKPEKPLKDEIEEVEKVEDNEDGENGMANDIASKEMRISSAEKNNKKRKRKSQSKETAESAYKKNGTTLSKYDGFRHNGETTKKQALSSCRGRRCMQIKLNSSFQSSKLIVLKKWFLETIFENTFRNNLSGSCSNFLLSSWSKLLKEPA